MISPNGTHPRSPEPTRTSAGARIKAGVVESMRVLGTRTKQRLELVSTGARTHIKIRKEINWSQREAACFLLISPLTIDKEYIYPKLITSNLEAGAK